MRKPPPQVHPRPFQSQLWKHLDQLRVWRRQKWSWRQIAEALGTQHGIEISFQAVHDFFRRASRRKRLPLGFEEKAPRSGAHTGQAASTITPVNLQKTPGFPGYEPGNPINYEPKD
jgi:hypothetical protein